VEGFSLFFQAIKPPFSFPGPLKTGLRREIEEKGESWLQPSGGDLVHGGDDLQRKPAAISLIGDCRIGKPVAKDNRPPSKGRPNNRGNMISTGGFIKKKLSFRGNRLF